MGKVNTPYWKKMEVQPSFKEWLEFWNGCVHCGCDHGCNQWIMEQNARAGLLFMIMGNPKKTTDLDKVVKMPLKKVNKIWFRIISWQSEKFNRELRKNEG